MTKKRPAAISPAEAGIFAARAEFDEAAEPAVIDMQTHYDFLSLKQQYTPCTPRQRYELAYRLLRLENKLNCWHTRIVQSPAELAARHSFMDRGVVMEDARRIFWRQAIKDGRYYEIQDARHELITWYRRATNYSAEHLAEDWSDPSVITWKYINLR